jgi:Effector Associated Constant Component 1
MTPGKTCDRFIISCIERGGRVRPVEAPARPEVLGPSLTELLVDVAGPGGVALAAALVAWARSPRGDVDLTMRRLPRGRSNRRRSIAPACCAERPVSQ